ncbi:hypothetical protein RIF29_18643 [Crotalaria pallida]|uniref:Uncharacterized protein n=1 Tax=Crotalaria pallida TaxID=3830 RepID=A0AAN9I5Q5_CROPI
MMCIHCFLHLVQSSQQLRLEIVDKVHNCCKNIIRRWRSWFGRHERKMKASMLGFVLRSKQCKGIGCKRPCDNAEMMWEDPGLVIEEILVEKWISNRKFCLNAHLESDVIDASVLEYVLGDISTSGR